MKLSRLALAIALTPVDLGAVTSSLLLGGRVLQGLSTACIMPAALALLKRREHGVCMTLRRFLQRVPTDLGNRVA